MIVTAAILEEGDKILRFGVIHKIMKCDDGFVYYCGIKCLSLKKAIKEGWRISRKSKEKILLIDEKKEPRNQDDQHRNYHCAKCNPKKSKKGWQKIKDFVY